MSTTSPKAERFADRMPLPLTVEPVAKELYGTTSFVLDRWTAEKALAARGIRGEARDAALAILEARVDIFR